MRLKYGKMISYCRARVDTPIRTRSYITKIIEITHPAPSRWRSSVCKSNCLIVLCMLFTLFKSNTWITWITTVLSITTWSSFYTTGIKLVCTWIDWRHDWRWFNLLGMRFKYRLSSSMFQNTITKNLPKGLQIGRALSFTLPVTWVLK